MTPRCLLCPQAPTEHLLAWERGHDIHRCTACGLIFATPLPSADELAAWYQGFAYHRPTADAVAAGVADREAELARWFDVRPGARWLDFGGGNGLAAEAARRLGFDVTFLELDASAAEFAVQQLGLPAERVHTDPATLPDGGFDAIFSDNVVEHVPDPVGFVGDLYDRLAPGGRLVLKTPRAGAGEVLFYPSIWGKGYLRRALRTNPPIQALAAFRQRWWSCDPPRHLYGFSDDSLVRLAERVGAPARVESYRVPLWAYSVSKRVFRRPRSGADAARKVIAAPLLPGEWALKAVQAAAVRAGRVTAGGAALILEKPLSPAS